MIKHDKENRSPDYKAGFDDGVSWATHTGVFVMSCVLIGMLLYEAYARFTDGFRLLP